tara:strand:- start:17957 stop:19402 length:1446 start_codon:yes stop_codon:yes gene_type:complete
MMQADLSLLMPEIVLGVATTLILLLDVYLKPAWKGLTYLMSQVALFLTFYTCWVTEVGASSTAFSGQFIADPLSQTLKLFILGLMIVVILYSRAYVRDRDMARGEFHTLALFSTLGMMLLVSANSLLMIYLGLELLSLPLYVLVAIRRDKVGPAEAGMKYFVMGALASGLLLYGISILYGVTNSIDLQTISAYVSQANASQMSLLLFAMVFIIMGIAFKLGAAPCHMWVPDVYEGAPTNVVMLIGSVPKIAAFGMVYRLLNDGLLGLATEWGQFFIVMALLSLALGNIVAIAQTNIKRLLAYSTIAHIGFLLLALLAAPVQSFAPAMYYVVVYAIMSTCAFGVLILLSAKGIELEKLEDLKGLCQRSPWISFLMLLVMFSLAGVPPTVGFYAKFMVLKALVDMQLVWLAAVGVIFSIIGAFYYLRVVWYMYFEKASIPNAVGGVSDMRAVLSIHGLAILGLGILPAPLFTICQQVFMVVTP